jgi:lipid-A-disaccharide synthase
MIAKAGVKVPISLVEENAYSAMKACDAAIVCSGTATLELALLGTPMIITNKGTMLTYAVAKSLIRVPYIGLPNLILGERRIPELLQFDATPPKIADEILRLLSDDGARDTMKRDLKEVSRRLGESGANRCAALEILKVLGK